MTRRRRPDLETRSPLDVRALVRQAGDRAEHRGRWGEAGAYQLALEPAPGETGVLTLAWSVAGEVCRQAVGLEATDQPFGGRRWWARCPGPSCGRRCAVLALGPDRRRFGCRVCLRLSYRTQHLDAMGRAHVAAAKLRRQHGAAPSIWAPWSKPRGMHATTWQRLLERDARAFQALQRGLGQVVAKVSGAVARLGR